MCDWDFDEHRRDGQDEALGPVWNASTVMTISAWAGGPWTICNRWKCAAQIGQVCRVNTLSTAGITGRVNKRGGHWRVICEVRLWGRSGGGGGWSSYETWNIQQVLTQAGAQGGVTGRPLGWTCNLSEPVLLLVPHPAVLKPDLDLAIGELQPSSHLQPPWTTQVRAEVELLLQLQQLAVGEGRSLPPNSKPSSTWRTWHHSTADWCWRRQKMDH